MFRCNPHPNICMVNVNGLNPPLMFWIKTVNRMVIYLVFKYCTIPCSVWRAFPSTLLLVLTHPHLLFWSWEFCRTEERS